MYCIYLIILIVTLLFETGAIASEMGREGGNDLYAGEISAPSLNSTGMVFDGNFLWISDWKEDMIYKIDPVNGKVMEHIPSPGPAPTGLAWDGTHLWVCDLHFNKAYRINVSTGMVVWEIPLPGSYPLGLTWDGKYLWVADRNEKLIMKISPTDGTIVDDIPSPGGEITGLAFFNGYLWASNRIDDEIYMIDVENRWVVNIYKSPGPYPWGLAFWRSKILVVDYNDGKIYILKITPEKRSWIRSGRKDYTLDFTLDFYNYGKDTIDSGEMVIAVSTDRENQNIMKGPVYLPEPDKIETNKINQKFAVWKIEKLVAPAKKRVSVKWDVSLYNVDWYIFPEKVGTQKDIPTEIKKIYLLNTEKYMLNDPFIVKTVDELVGKEKNLYKRARKIYEWVIDKLEYKLVGGWENAPKVLKRGSGSCSEYTFSFISLCRAAGIPARFVGSIVVRRDDSSVDDVFHRWAEIYLPPYGWVPVDANHGDKPDGRGRALGFGHLTSNLFITTVEGAVPDNKLGWSYNYNATYTYKGEANTYLEGIGFWRPLVREKKSACVAPGSAESSPENVCECGMP